METYDDYPIVEHRTVKLPPDDFKQLWDLGGQLLVSHDIRVNRKVLVLLGGRRPDGELVECELTESP